MMSLYFHYGVSFAFYHVESFCWTN